MANKLDLSGNDLIIGDVYMGASTPGSAGAVLSDANLAVVASVTPGTAAASKALVLDSVKGLTWAYTSASTNGSSSVEPLALSSTLTGIGGVGGRAHFSLTSNVALGSWSNALKGEMTYGASGRTTGLGSAVLAEMTLSAGTSSGTYAPLEIELNLGTSASTGTQTSLIYASVNGAAASTFDTSGYLMSINGLTSNTNKCFKSGLTQAVTASAAIRIKIGATDYFIPLCAVQALTS